MSLKQEPTSQQETVPNPPLISSQKAHSSHSKASSKVVTDINDPRIAEFASRAAYMSEAILEHDRKQKEIIRTAVRHDFWAHVVKDVLLYLPFLVITLPPVRNTIDFIAPYGPTNRFLAFLISMLTNILLPLAVQIFLELAARNHLSPKYSTVGPGDINPYLRSPSLTSWQMDRAIALNVIPIDFPRTGATAWARPAMHVIGIVHYMSGHYDWTLLSVHKYQS